MIRIEHSEYLIYGLLAVAATLCLFYILWKRRALVIKKLGDFHLVKTLLPSLSKRWWYYTASLSSLAVMSIFLAAANPQFGSNTKDMKSESSDIYIAFDISDSMLAKDEIPTRLDRAKRFTENLIQTLRGNRIGMIYFAGESYLQMPLTLDYAAAISAVKTAHPTFAGRQGTSISGAIDKARETYKEGDAINRVLIIISDGEDHEAAVDEAIEKAVEDGMVIYTVGVGTNKGAYVPGSIQSTSGYKKDKDGNPVLSKVNTDMLRSIAADGNGAFYMVNQGKNAIKDIENRLVRMEKEKREVKSFEVKNSYFQLFLSLAFLILLIEWFFELDYFDIS